MARSLVLPGAGLALSVASLSLASLDPPTPDPDADRRALARHQARWISAALAKRPADPATRLPLRAVSKGERGLPPPTEHWLADDAELSQKSRRKRWMMERHRAPPGVDTKAIERSNGRAQVARRARMAIDGEPTTGTWVERGSDNLAGRMHAAQVSSDGSLLVAGSSKGGLWTLDRAAPEAAWTPIADQLYGGCHWLGLLDGEAAGDPPIIVASTDWGYVNRSDDLGETWTEAQLVGVPSEVRRVASSTDGSGAVFVVTVEDSHTRVQRSTDGGLSFEQVADLGGYRGDIFVPRDGSSRIFLAAGEELWASDDLGESWEVVGPGPGGAEANLAGSEAGAPTLYAIVDDARLWRSDDAGQSWQDMGRVADFWGRMSASIVDPAMVTWGGFELYRSYDGGQSHLRVNEWGEYYGREHDRLHADIMGVEVVPDGAGGETWLIGTDGGLYESSDQLQTVANLSMRGLRVSQYYSTLTHVDDASIIAAGAQDQGYQVSLGIQDSGRYDFDQALSGDYAHLVSGDGSHELVYSVYPGFILVQVGEGGGQLAYVSYPSQEDGRYFAWLPPLTADRDDPSAFFFAATHLYRYEFDGDQWQPEQWSDQDFSASSYEFLSAFELAGGDSSRAYAATSYGRLFSSDDGGLTWDESRDDGPYSHYFHGTALLVDPEDPDTAWVGGSGYGGPAVYRTTDGGDGWDDWADGLPDTTVYDFAMAIDGSRRVFAGTETAAYVRGPYDDEWQDITSAGAPITTYWSVEALQTENTVRFGTYGRGIWDYQYDEAPLPPEEGTDTGADPTRPEDGSSGPGGCGCGGGAPAGLAFALPALLALVRRRRP